MSLTHYPYRVASVAKLTALGIDDATARHVRAILHGDMEPTDVPETAAWVRACYRDPPWREQARHAADALIGGHGIEAVQGADADETCAPLFHYSNAGDSYNATLIFRGSDAFVSTVGDMVESLERRGIKVR